MGVFLDAGQAMTPGKTSKKNGKKGFKCDRRENYERMITKKTTGKDVRKRETKPVRVKSVTFDSNALRDYVLTLHKKKNERRVMAFVDAKRKMKRDHSKTRQQQREEARRAYNNYARIPILPNYTFNFPSTAEDPSATLFGEEEEMSDEPSVASEEEVGESTPWMDLGEEGNGIDAAAEEAATAPKNEKKSRQRRRAMAMATVAHSTHAMPTAMTADSGAEEGIDVGSVTVEVRPLNFRPMAAVDARGTASTLPSQNFSDLPAVVEQELRRMRKESKGPSRTKPKTHMMKELEKIRKIKKHSRKGHGKKSTSGKRKNRKK